MDSSEKRIEKTKASLQIEGLLFSDELKNMLIDCTTGKKTYEETRKEVVKRFSKVSFIV